MLWVATSSEILIIFSDFSVFNHPLSCYIYLLFSFTAAFSFFSICAYTNAYKTSKTSDATKKKRTIGSATRG